MNDILSLEKELTTIEVDAKSEEQANADSNFSILKGRRRELEKQIPNPEVHKYDTLPSYDDSFFDLQHAKDQNQNIWEQIDELDEYLDNRSLYAGHLVRPDNEYYITEVHKLKSKEFVHNNKVFHIINTEDKNYAATMKAWRYPGDEAEGSVVISRVINLNDKTVESVEVRMDRSNGSYLFADITDHYLRRALIKNKDGKLHSIVRTIQKKQDDIRSQPFDKSFIVQGFAGSGKTMVLLHRLKYLKYNRYISAHDYLVLVPSSTFLGFVESAFDEFSVNKSDVFQFTDYYKSMIDKRDNTPEYSELVFDEGFLRKVYSEKFMQECYRELFNNISSNIFDLVGLGDRQLNILIENRKTELKNEYENIEKTLISEIGAIIEPFSGAVSTKIASADDIETLIRELERALNEASKLPTVNNAVVEIEDDDPRLKEDARLLDVEEEIEKTRVMLSKASIFTKKSYEKKLDKLLKGQKDLVATVKKELQEYDRKKAEEVFVFPGVGIKSTKEIIEKIKETRLKTVSALKHNNELVRSISDYVSGNNEKVISDINMLISMSEDYDKTKNNLVDSLRPVSDTFKDTIRIAMGLGEWLREYADDSMKREVEKLKFYSLRNERRIESWLNTTLDSIIKKRIKVECSHVISKNYKHYWYLTLYSRYLTRGIVADDRAVIFIDEAQDLCKSELNLIYKINERVKPSYNIFGDVKQGIAAHNVKDWSEIEFINTVYELDENFRNPTQIVEHCNSEFDFTMKDVGVSVEPVNIVESIVTLKDKLNKASELNFIVKDDYYKADLNRYLVTNVYLKANVFTVKEVKGLEFKEVFVVDHGMTQQEKYVAYTRPLSKLNIIHSIPQLTDHSKNLIVEGEE